MQTLLALAGPLGARYKSTKEFALPDRDILCPAAFSQTHDQPNTDSAFGLRWTEYGAYAALSSVGIGARARGGCAVGGWYAVARCVSSGLIGRGRVLWLRW